MSALVAGIDVATQAARVVCCDGQGSVAARGSAPLPKPASPRAGWMEQDATSWWPAVGDALAQATDELGSAREDVRAVAVAATSGTLAVVDDSGQPLGPGLMYNDQRTEAEATAAQDAGAARWAELGLRMGTSFGLPKLAWLLSREEIRAKARHCWHASDVVVARLIGESPPTDWSHGLKTGYDVVHQEWPAEVFEALGIPLELLPPVLPPTTRIGHVSEEVAGETGLPQTCEVRLGMTDSCASQIASGADTPGRFVSVMGTSLVLKGASESLLKDESGALYSHRHPDGWWLPGGASNLGGRSLSHWFEGADLSDLDHAAAQRGPAGYVFYPLVGSGERFPFLEPKASSFEVGEPRDDVERYRATLEGVAFSERLSYAYLSLLGAAIESPVVLSGGGSRSAVWNRLRATVMRQPLEVAKTGETAFGAGILAAAGSLHNDLASARQAMVDKGDEVEPASEEEAPLQDSYERFVEGLFERGWIGEELLRAAVGERT